MPEPRQLLADDHRAVSDVLHQLLTALDTEDVPTTYAKLDLLWARLAVHIRAEHLHLFPAVGSKLNEASAVIATLREDHDFFMRELAQAIGVVRDLPDKITNPTDSAKLTVIGKTVREIEARLATHNELEEEQIYLWASTILSKSEQTELFNRINHELENRPPRFSLKSWENESGSV